MKLQKTFIYKNLFISFLVLCFSIFLVNGDASENQPDSIGEQHVAVVLANFQDRVEETYPLVDVQDASSELNSFIREVSYQKTWITSEIFGWYTLPITVGTTCPSTSLINSESIKALDPDVDFNVFDRLIILTPNLDDVCTGPSAVSSIGKGNKNTDDGLIPMSIVTIINPNFFISKTIAHEFIHSLGVGHASILRCGNEVISESCDPSNFSNDYDVMSANPYSHFNSIFKEELGMLDQNNIIELSTAADSGIYTLKPFEIITNEPQVLKIHAPKRTYYLEWRQPIGYDAEFQEYPYNPYNGVLVYLDEPGASARLLDMKPNNHEDVFDDLKDASLDVNQSFTDETGVTFQVINKDATGLHVMVDIPKLSKDTIKVNFQPTDSDLPAGYIKDFGEKYILGKDRGWTNVYGLNTVEADIHSDQRLDTFISIDLYTTRTWEMNLPNRDYLVSFASGDPSSAQGLHNIEIEGTLVVDNVATAINEFVQITDYPVTVSDHKLSVTLKPGAGNNSTLLNYIEIKPVNHNPQFNSISNHTIDPGQTLSFTVSAVDEDVEDDLVYSATNLPNGAVFNPDTQTFLWTPTENDVGNYFDLQFHVTDGIDTDTEVIGITVIGGFHPWQENASGNPITGYTWNYTMGYHFTPQKDGQITQLGGFFNGSKNVFLYEQSSADVLAQASVTAANDWSFSDITPVNVVVGKTYTVAVQLAGSGGSSQSGVNFPQTYGDIKIEASTYLPGNGKPVNSIGSAMYGQADIGFIPATNTAPIFTTTAKTTAVKNSVYTYDVNATDPDGDSISYSLIQKPAGMSINTMTGVINWTPSALGSHTVEIKAEDSRGLFRIQSYVLDVKLVDEQAPWQDNINGNQVMNQPWNYTMGYHFTPQVDGQITAVGGKFNGTKTVSVWNKTTGAMLAQRSVTATNDFGYTTITPAINVVNGTSYTVAITLAGSGGSYSSGIANFPQTYGDIRIDSSTYIGGNNRPTNTITNYMYGQADIKFVPEGEIAPNQAPELNSIGNQSVNEGELLEFTISATDSDVGDTLTFSASNLPTGASFNPTTKTLTWTPTFTQAGSFPNVHFEVTDGTDSDSEDITITVNNINQAPVFDPIGAKSVNEGENLNFVVNATDIDGDNLFYIAGNLPEGATFTPETQTFDWTPDFLDAGSYDVSFLTSDGILLGQENVTITVNNVNLPIMMNPIEAKNIDEGEELSFIVVADSPDLDLFSWNVTNLPTGANVEPVLLGDLNADGSVADSDFAQFLSLIGTTDAKGDFNNDGVVNDSDVAIFNFNYGKNTSSNDAIFGRRLTWTPTFNQSGNYNVTFSVSEGADNASEVVSITVNDIPAGQQLSGVIMDFSEPNQANGGVPLADAAVEVRKDGALVETVMTDATGRYTTGFIGVGMIELLAAKDHYAIQPDNGSAQFGEPFAFELTLGAQIPDLNFAGVTNENQFSGVVMDFSEPNQANGGVPLADAAVEVRKDGALVETVMTDATGRYTTGFIGVGMIELLAAKDHYAIQPDNGSAQFGEPFAFELTLGAQIPDLNFAGVTNENQFSGVVMDFSEPNQANGGVPLADAAVEVRKDGALVETVMTDATGRYTTGFIGVGMIELLAAKDHYAIQPDNGSAQFGEPFAFELTLGAQIPDLNFAGVTNENQFSGVVMDFSEPNQANGGVPLADAAVEVRKDGVLVETVMTDATGRYTTGFIGVGMIELLAAKDHYAIQPDNGSAQFGEPFAFELTLGAQIPDLNFAGVTNENQFSGVVMDFSEPNQANGGVPLADAAVEVRKDGVLVETVMTDATGRYTTGFIGVGMIELLAAKDHYAIQPDNGSAQFGEPFAFELTLGAQIPDLNFAGVTNENQLSGIIMDFSEPNGSTGVPLVGAAVEVRHNGSLLETVTTDASGRYTTSFIGLGMVELVASKVHYGISPDNNNSQFGDPWSFELTMGTTVPDLNFSAVTNENQLSGIIMDFSEPNGSTGVPLVGAAVEVRHNGSLLETVTTDASGRYTTSFIGLGMVELVASKVHYGISPDNNNSQFGDPWSFELTMGTTVPDLNFSALRINQDPVLNSIGAKNIDEGELLSFVVSANDPDTNDVLNYTATNLPSGASFNATTQTFSWTPTFDQSGSFPNILFTVNDGNGGVDSENITITVNNVNTQSQTPWQSNAYGNQALNLAYNYTMGYHFTPQKDGQINQLGGLFNGTKNVRLYNKSTGALLASTTTTSANDWGYADISPVNVQAGSTYTVAVELAGSGASYRTGVNFPQTYGDIKIEATTYIFGSGIPVISNTNIMYGQADIGFIPAADTAPIFTSTAKTTAIINSAYTYDVNAFDPDGQNVTYSLQQNPAGMSINGSSGVINWTPTALGSYNVSIKAEDTGGLSRIQSYVLEVKLIDEQNPWQTNINGNQGLNQGWNYTMGYHFTPQTDGKISGLGGKFNGTKNVKLWNKATGALLAQASVSAANDFAYSSISPINVTAGTTYTVSVEVGGSGGSYSSGIASFPQTYGDIRIESSTYASGNTRPTIAVTTAMYGQADVVFEPN